MNGFHYSFLQVVFFFVFIRTKHFVLVESHLNAQMLLRHAVKFFLPFLGTLPGFEIYFNEIKDNCLHKLHGLLPPRNLSTVSLRKKRAFNVPLTLQRQQAVIFIQIYQVFIKEQCHDRLGCPRGNHLAQFGCPIVILVVRDNRTTVNFEPCF